MSGRSLAEVLGKSEKYVRERLNGSLSFSLNDVEMFSGFLGVEPEVFVSQIERSVAEVTPIRLGRAVTAVVTAADRIDHVEAPNFEELDYAAKRGKRKADAEPWAE